MACSALFLPLLIFYLTSASQDQREINVKPGDNVTLPCQSPNDKAITLLEWSRPELKEDGYVFFYRNDRSYESYQHATVVGRVQLKDASMKDGDLSVILKNVNINDTGIYECRIINSNTEGRERDYTETKHVIHLTVTDPGET
ncbi:sodium channel subunit beta-3-like isoform X2 [Scomber japonicus]|uniref:sodium channel subunit beta-3-like isoform X2 n=1 Tax=Scomber japonicus TaxID=13676 RepID=UPI00230594E5|nr:sodium channel subunit beta-3-like isoform X2 [Scomber japonicus]